MKSWVNLYYEIMNKNIYDVFLLGAVIGFCGGGFLFLTTFMLFS